MTDPTVRGPDVSWMTAWELWAWEQIAAGKVADMSLVHKAYRVDADDKPLDDAEKDPVVQPLEVDEDGVPQPVDVDRWLSWQTLSGRFVERVAANPTFISARNRNLVHLESARIEDAVDLEAEVLPGNFMLTYCRFDMALILRGVEIGGMLNVSSSHFLNGIGADRLRVGGGAFFRNGGRYEGEVRLLGADIGGSLECLGSYFKAGPEGTALSADGIRTGGSIFLNGGARFEGGVRFPVSNVGTTIECSGSYFTAAQDGTSFSAESMNTGGTVFLNGGAHFEGEIRLLGANIGGALDCSGATFTTGPEHDVLVADAIKTDGSVFLNGGSHFDGKVRLLGANIRGILDCSGSNFVAGADGDALGLDGLKIDGNLFLNNGARFAGTVRLMGVQIGGVLDCSGAHFTAGRDNIAIIADGMKVGGSVFLRDGARFEGTIVFASVVLGDSLQLSGSQFENEVDLSSASIQSDIRLDETKLGAVAPEWQPGARLNLQNATVGALQGSLDAWRMGEGKQAPFVDMNLDGLSFKRLSGGVGGDSLDIAEHAELLSWLEAGSPAHADKKRGFSRSPYVATANALASAGRADAARSVRIALEKRKTGELRFGPRKLIERYLIGPLTGYGYRPSNGLFWLMGLIVLFAFIGNAWVAGGVQEMFQPFSLVKAKEWLGFSFETIVPFFDLDPIQDTFLQDQFGIAVDQFGNKPYDQLPTGLRALFMAERVAGVVVLSTLVAGLTGWAERRGE